MRILIIGAVYPDSFADNLLVALKRTSHDMTVAALYPDKINRTRRLTTRLRSELQAMPRLARRLQRPVLDAAERHRPELVLNLDHQLSFGLVPDLRTITDAPVAFWFRIRQPTLGVRRTCSLATTQCF